MASAQESTLGFAFAISLLTWLWLVVVLVMGGELNSEREHQTAKDTTTGSAEPIGQRGGTVADELGERHGKG